ncbi:MAG: ribonuclease Y [Nitrospinae bacterium]|nr:ribonuclease Y [Nitrospinota bacterium]
MDILIYVFAALAAGVGLGFAIRKNVGGKQAEETVNAAKNEAGQILTHAKKEAETITKEASLVAKEAALKAQAEFDVKITERKNEIEQLEKRLLNREKILDKKLEQTERQERELARKETRVTEIEKSLAKKEEEYGQLVEDQISKLQQVSGMTPDEAKEELKERLLETARLESAMVIKKIEDQAKSEGTERAQKIIANAIQRYASDYVAENTVSVVDLPSDEMKGRIIGREGRNIRALEVATGVDLIIDDTPNAVILSCFDPVKREVARLTLERLIHDGRIHPGRIEDTVEKMTKEVNNLIREEGEKACFELGVDGIHPELIKILGRLKFRTSYSQNVLRHSIEVGFLAGIMAAELGQNVKLAKRAGLLHDIGKALDHNVEGTHTQIGFDVARRHNEPKVVLNSIASHHEDVPAESVIAVLVAAADALSASRPGARREMLENYIKRMQKLEEIGNSFGGVEKTYAIQAGREIRVVVKPETVKDSEAFFLAKDIARKIEGELAYPGEIKVTVIRETRVTDFAR